jgi:UDPglucose 6-dehydrogenase
MINKICVIGMWHLGCVTAACLAKLGFDVTCVDFDKGVMNDLAEGKLPISEPGLDELFHEGVSAGRIRFSTDIVTARKSDVVYITFDTPVDKNDRVDLSIIHKAADSVIPNLAEDSVLMISSQVPVGTCDEILQKIRKAGKKNEVCYTPENLRLGNAIDCFMKPGRIIFGLSSPGIRSTVEQLFSGIEARHFFMSLRSAEMAKHTLNAYLATMISFSGEISDLCEKTGANATDVMNALKSERRVSEHAPVMPGLGFGGGTLARDVQVLRNTGKKHGMKTHMMDAVISANDRRMSYVSDKLSSVLGPLENKRIAFLGLVYKTGTSTLRRSLALQVIDNIKPKLA